MDRAQEIRELDTNTFEQVQEYAIIRPDFAYVVEKYALWLSMIKLLDDVWARYRAVDKSYAHRADADACVATHKALLERVTTSDPARSDPPLSIPPTGYLLSARFIADLSHGGSVFAHWLHFAYGALQSSRPHVSKFSILRWHSIESLEPMIRHLDEMTRPRGGKAGTRFNTRRATRAYELLFHWMDHAWGFAQRAPHAHLLHYQILDEVASDMEAFAAMS